MILPALPLLALSIPSLAAPAPPTSIVIAQDELDAVLDERIEALSGAPIAELWKEAQRLATLVGDESGSAFDAAVDRRLRATPEGEATTILFLVATRRLGEDVDDELLVERLRPLLDSSQEDVVLATAHLLGDPDNQRLDSDLREQMADDLLRIASDGNRAPEIRIECAAAAHRVCLGSQVHRARRVLFDFLNSAEPQLRSMGALALASLGLIEEVRGVESELEHLSGLPGEEGRLAAAYLGQQRIRRHMDSQLRTARERASSMATRSAGSDPDLARMSKILEFVLAYHLEGNLVSRDDLIDSALDGMLRSLDQHSAYFSPDIYKRFEQDLEAEYGGIGAYVREDPADSLFTITRPIYSGPAYKAGLHTDDKIVRIEDWPTIGKDVDEIIRRLKGRPKTPVKLYVWRYGMDAGLIDRPTEDMAVSLVRDQIVIPPVHSEMLPGDIALIELTTFSRVASPELKRRIDEMLDAGARGFIFDLRNNSGGLLSEARNVADLFLPKGQLVVSTESRLGRAREYPTENPALVPEGMPVTVLINRFSASAAEIVSGALQDHGRAKLVGQRSFGKGSVQNLFRSPSEEDDQYADENNNRRWDNWETITKDWDGDGEFDYAPRIKLTVERYLLPTGRSIHRELDDEGNIVSPGGVEPDILVQQKRWPQWRLQEILRIQREHTVQEWARDHFAGNEELYERLATGDEDDPDAYPGFDELYASLETVLPPDDVRFLLRRSVRRLVQDLRGEAFPQGDYQEDLQLQEGLRVVLEELDEPLDSIPAYALTFDEPDEETDGTPASIVAATGGADRTRLDAALSLIAEAEERDGQISQEDLQELTELITDLREKRKN